MGLLVRHYDRRVSTSLNNPNTYLQEPSQSRSHLRLVLAGVLQILLSNLHVFNKVFMLPKWKTKWRL
jgi:hypothetical protein